MTKLVRPFHQILHGFLNQEPKRVSTEDVASILGSARSARAQLEVAFALRENIARTPGSFPYCKPPGSVRQ